MARVKELEFVIDDYYCKQAASVVDLIKDEGGSVMTAMKRSCPTPMGSRPSLT